MTKIESWEEFSKAAERLYQSDPFKVRYNIKYRHCDGKLVLTVTDDQVRLQYETQHAQDVKKIEKLTASLLRMMLANAGVEAMSQSSKSPIKQVQASGDELKKQVDAVEKSINELIKKGDDISALNQAYQKCIALKLQSSELLVEAHGLLQQNEKARVQNFNTKKNEEIQRIQKLQSRLNILMDQVESSSSEVEHLRSLRHGQSQVQNDSQGTTNDPRNKDETNEDDDDDEEEEDFEGDDGYEEDDANLFEVINSFEAEEDDDLTVAVGDVVAVIERQDDGWWKVKDEAKNIGMVPSNFLREYVEEEEEEEEEEERERKEENDETEDTLRQDTEEPPASGEEMPTRSIAQSDTSVLTPKTDVTDVLAALGALPAGFRPSTLGRFSVKEEYTLRNSLLPAFTESNTGLLDLQWDPALNQIRPLPTRVLRSCRLWSCRMIPLAGSGVEVLSRHVRLALFNGTNVLSNIHTVRATWSANSAKLWTFSPRVPGILPSLLDGSCTVRSDITHSNLGILFELCVTYVRTPPRRIVHFSDGPEAIYSDSDDEGARTELAKTGEHAELSCGWAFLKLFDEQGVAIPNKTYELALHGGTPYEKGVAVDPSIARRASTSRLRNLLTANKHPKLIVKLGTPNATRKKILNLLPSNIVMSSSYCEHVSYYRRILADALIRDRLSLRDADPIPCPFLSTFPDAAMQPDIIDAVRSAWTDKLKTFRRGDKRDKENVKMSFKGVFVETAYILLHSSSLPESRWAQQQIEQERWQKIYQHLQAAKAATSTPSGVKIDSTNAILKSLLSSNAEHLPFDMNELSFNLVKDYKKPISGMT